MKEKITIISKNGKGDGILPMKQSGEVEDSKSLDQKSEELCNFIKNAFCADGDVVLARSNGNPFTSKEFFIVDDSKRGQFLVAIKKV